MYRHSAPGLSWPLGAGWWLCAARVRDTFVSPLPPLLQAERLPKSNALWDRQECS